MRSKRSAAASQRRPAGRDLRLDLYGERRDARGHGGEEPIVGRVVRLDLVAVDIDLADHRPIGTDRNDDLRPRFEKAGEVLWCGPHVVDHDGPILTRGLAADPLAHGDRHVLRRGGTGPGGQPQRLAVPEIDPDPAVMAELVPEVPADLSERLDAGEVAQDGIDLQQGGRVLDGTNGRGPSPPPEIRGSAEGENFRRVGLADLGV
jgi:hypothetical protein